MSYDLFKVVENRAAQETFLKARFVIFRCQKYVKKGYMEMGKWIYLETLKSVLGRSVFHYSRQPIANFIHFNCKILSISIVNKDNHLFLQAFRKMIVCWYELHINIFREACLFFYLLCRCGTSKPMDSNLT